MKKFLLIAMVLAAIIPAARAGSPPAVPVKAVESEALIGDRAGQLTVLELFSSQACVFCPKADALMGDLVQNENIIGLSCHVDYFDVSEGALSRPFCTDRQNFYESALRAGPNFTPQMIVNGAHDVVGYKMQEVLDIIRHAGSPSRIPVSAQAPDVFAIALPPMKLKKPVFVSALFIDFPHSLTVAEGANRGKKMTYHNIVSRIDPVMEWDGSAQNIRAKIVLAKRHKGFVLLASDPETGRIVAAGQFRRAAPGSKKPGP